MSKQAMVGCIEQHMSWQMRIIFHRKRCNDGIGKILNATYLLWRNCYPREKCGPRKKVTDLTREERLTLIERAGNELPLRIQADLLGVSRASVYYQPRPPSAEEVQLKHRIDEIYSQLPSYGSRKIAAQLHREGMVDQPDNGGPLYAGNGHRRDLS